MHGLDWYDYGARYYDAVISQFTTIDPLAEKYYSISPYAYCAGNPVMFVDPDGRKIEVGNLTGRILAWFGYKNFEWKAQRDLDVLYKSDEAFKNVIDRMEKSDEVYRVLDLKVTSKYKDKGNFYDLQNKSIYYDPDNRKREDGQERDPIIALSHELGHVENDLNGTRKQLDSKKLKKRDPEELKKREENEERSIELENITRKKLGEDLRLKY